MSDTQQNLLQASEGAPGPPSTSNFHETGVPGQNKYDWKQCTLLTLKVDQPPMPVKLWHFVPFENGKFPWFGKIPPLEKAMVSINTPKHIYMY